MADQIQRLGSRANQKAIGKLNFSFEMFRNEAGTQLNYLKVLQAQLDGEVGRLEKAVCIKLTESTERSDKQENVVCGLFSAITEVALELVGNR